MVRLVRMARRGVLVRAFKRVSSVLLALLLVMGGISTPALAEAVDEATGVQNASEVADELRIKISDFAARLPGETASEKVYSLYSALADVPVGMYEGDEAGASLAALNGEQSSEAGIAHAFVLVASEVGINAIEVKCSDTNVWCMVEVDDGWRHVNPVAAVDSQDTSWFLLTDEQVREKSPGITEWTLRDGGEAPKSEAAIQGDKTEDEAQQAETQQAEAQQADDMPVTETTPGDEAKADERATSVVNVQTQSEAQLANEEEAADLLAKEEMRRAEEERAKLAEKAQVEHDAKESANRKVTEDKRQEDKDSKGLGAQTEKAAAKTSVASAKITVADQGYTGKALTPQVSVAVKGKTLKSGTDYDVRYANNTEVGTAKVTVTGKGSYEGTKTASFRIVSPSVSYRVHVQRIGDQAACKDGATAGTTGESKRLEAIWINLGSGFPVSGGVEYKTHIQSYGWQGWSKQGAPSGTTGQAKRLEAICIRLTGEMAKTYSIYYRVHAQKVGWMAWAKDGETAGTSGLSWRLEAIQIKIVPKGKPAPSASGSATGLKYLTNPGVTYHTHVQHNGWMGWVKNGALSGTQGESKRLEGIEIKLGTEAVPGGIEYRTHVQRYGWQGFVSDGAMSGTSGEHKRLEAIEIKLTGEVSKYFDVWYRTHVQTYGWLGWTKNGGRAGTASLSKRMEAIQIQLVRKGGSAPGSTENSFIDRDPTRSGDIQLDAMIDEFIGQTGTGYAGLRRAYDIISTYPYSQGNRWPGPNWEQWSIPYAKEMYVNKTGNCYRYASLMCWTARRLGYDAKVVPGWIPGRVNPHCDHGWVEVNLDGQIYVIDAEMNGDDGYPEYEWFMIKYADAYLRYYDLNDNRILR